MIYIDGYILDKDHWAGGELKFILPKEMQKGIHPFPEPERIIAYISNTDDLMQLFLLKNALFYAGVYTDEFYVDIPYLPYARQDRVTEKGGFNGLDVIIRTLDSHSIYCRFMDVHNPNHGLLRSKIDDGIFENMTALDIIKKNDIISNYLKYYKPVIVSPDLGAIDRAFEVARYFELPFVTCRKDRGENGHPTISANWDLNLKKPHYFFIDDLCDGGRTFIELSKVLRAKHKNNTNNVMLDVKVDGYVTHGLFSNPDLHNGKIYYQHPNGVIDNIFYTNSLGQDADYIAEPDKVFRLQFLSRETGYVYNRHCK